MDNAKITFKLNIKNIGPHEDLDFSEGGLGSLELLIYSNNGNGKTSISRLFRCFEGDQTEQSHLISFGKQEGSMEYEISRKDFRSSAKIKIKGYGPPDIDNRENKYIFHTFNSDYIEKNVQFKQYKLDNNISGHILLSEKEIDLSNEKEQLKNKENELEEIKGQIRKIVNEKKSDLDNKSLSISKSTTEYKDFTFENIIDGKDLGYPKEKSFDELRQEYSKLSSLPDDTEDIEKNTFNLDLKDLSSLNDILGQEYTKNNFAEEFKDKIKAKIDFVKSGVEIYRENGNLCPFCEQKLGDEASRLIDEYSKYLEDEEAKIIDKLNLETKSVQDLEIKVGKEYSKSLEIRDSFNKLKGYFPKFKEENIDTLLKMPSDAIRDILRKIEDKKSNIAKKFDINAEIKIIQECIDKNNEIVQNNNKIIQKINESKNDSSKDKLDLRKNICRAKHLEALTSTRDERSRKILVEEEIESLKKQISSKENKSRVSKKDKVVEDFKRILSNFFRDKYSFDEEKFCLRLNDKNLEQNAKYVLSEGEKSIVAFCLFLAEVHTKVNKEEDYKNIFFILDDPISSMDFTYVYTLCGIIKDLKKEKVFERMKIIILTHNLDFFNILAKNRIIQQTFVLRDSEIHRVKHELILPYEAHLRDVYKISINKENPNHTTPNSIRHILETIRNFESPKAELLDYCDKKSSLYTLIHDLSHGGFRNQRSFEDKMLIESCKEIIEFIENKFPRHLDIIKSS